MGKKKLYLSITSTESRHILTLEWLLISLIIPFRIHLFSNYIQNTINFWRDAKQDHSLIIYNKVIYHFYFYSIVVVQNFGNQFKKIQKRYILLKC